MYEFPLLLIAICSLCLLNGCGTSSLPPPRPIADFSIAVSPSSVSTQVGATTSPVTVSLNPQNGFTGGSACGLLLSAIPLDTQLGLR